jgi:hypothetical protein
VNGYNEIKSFAKAGTLWIFDRGFYDFIFFKDLIDQGVAWITRIKSNTKYKVKIVLLDSPHVRDQIILLTGRASKSANAHCRFLTRSSEEQCFYHSKTAHVRTFCA